MGTGSNRRLALIGPVTPFRGGIAQYTTELHRALSTRCELRTISFRRLYPAWLYPGETDQEPGGGRIEEPGVQYTLDALDPFTWARAASSIAAQGCDVAIVAWWTLFWAPGFALIARMLRKRGIPVVFLCHNLFDHDSGKLKRIVTTKLLSQGAGYLVHSSEQGALLRKLFADKPVIVHPHPTYDRFPPAQAAGAQRGRLELLFFGFIRPYKGLETLLDALAKLADRDVHLTVVGEPWCRPEELRARVKNAGAPNIDLHLEYVKDAEVANYFARSDLVVLPYLAASGSGVVAVAYHYDRPVLATRVGGFLDVVEEGRTGFLVDANSPEQLAERLRSISRPQLAQMRQHVAEFKSKLTWTSLADALVAFTAELPRNRRIDARKAPG